VEHATDRPPEEGRRRQAGQLRKVLVRQYGWRVKWTKQKKK
jgi:hypothetical protein